MPQYQEAAEYTAPDLEAALIASVQSSPDLYWEVLDLLPVDPVDAFPTHRERWRTLADAIEAMAPVPNLDGLGVPASADVERGRADLGQLQEGVRLFAGIAPRMAFLEGNRRTSVAYVQGRARQAMVRHGSKSCLVVVDFLQRMAHVGQYGNLRENVSSLTLGLRELAARLGSPVLGISACPEA